MRWCSLVCGSRTWRQYYCIVHDCIVEADCRDQRLDMQVMGSIRIQTSYIVDCEVIDSVARRAGCGVSREGTTIDGHI